MKLLGLIGNPVSHSQSPRIFREFFQEENRNDFTYGLFPLNNISELPEWIMKHPNLVGFNVTIPFKKQIIPYLNQLHPDAQKTGAVNTVKVLRETNSVRLIGFNTDIFGFQKSLLETFPILPSHALILGTGGASEAVATSLKNIGIVFQKVSRNEEGYLKYSDLHKNLLESHKLIIQTTPLGMHPNESEIPDIPYEFIGPDHCCMDLIYSPAETVFLKTCKAQGALITNGLKMLQYQAEAAWEIFKDESTFPVE